MSDLRMATLVFLIKKNGGNITDICLAMKKRGFGVNRYNGAGGKVKPAETVIEAAKRETQEEIGVVAGDLKKVAELAFYFPHNPAWDQMVHVYFCENWSGEIQESEEMKPDWFLVDSLPFNAMWPDDPFWLPLVIKGQLLKASFTFGEKDVILKKAVQAVDNF